MAAGGEVPGQQQHAGLPMGRMGRQGSAHRAFQSWKLPGAAVADPGLHSSAGHQLSHVSLSGSGELKS